MKMTNDDSPVLKMRLSEAVVIVEKKSHEKEAKKKLREYRERMDFLEKWVKRYSEELVVVRQFFNKARNRVLQIPSDSEYREAMEIINEADKIRSEIRKLKQKKARMK